MAERIAKNGRFGDTVKFSKNVAETEYHKLYCSMRYV